jgi:hypothetical protein
VEVFGPVGSGHEEEIKDMLVKTGCVLAHEYLGRGCVGNMAGGRCRERLGGDEEVQEPFQKVQLNTRFRGQFSVGYAGIVFVGDGSKYVMVDEELDNANLNHGIEVCVYGRRHCYWIANIESARG